MPSGKINRIFRDDQRLDARGGKAVRPIDWRVLSAILPGSHAGESSPRAISAAGRKSRHRHPGGQIQFSQDQHRANCRTARPMACG